MSGERILKTWETGTGVEAEGKATQRCSEAELLSQGCPPECNQSLAQPEFKSVPLISRDKGRLCENTEGSSNGKNREPRIRRGGASKGRVWHRGQSYRTSYFCLKLVFSVFAQGCF